MPSGTCSLVTLLLLLTNALPLVTRSPVPGQKPGLIPNGACAGSFFRCDQTYFSTGEKKKNKLTPPLPIDFFCLPSCPAAATDHLLGAFFAAAPSSLHFQPPDLSARLSAPAPCQLLKQVWAWRGHGQNTSERRGRAGQAVHPRVHKTMKNLPLADVCT